MIPERRSTVAIPHARRRLYDILARACRPRPLTTVSAWADKHRVLTSKGSGEPGQWRTERTPYLREILDQLSATSPTQRIVLMFAAQLGKALDLDTPIPTPSGWKRMGDIQAGDLVFDEYGLPVYVLVASEVFHNRDCFVVRFSDGAEIVADADHRWTVMDELDYRKRQSITLTTREIAETHKHRNRNRYAIPVTHALDLPEADLPIDPYTLGVWLGDGNSMSAQFTQHEADAPEIIAMIERAGHQVVERANRNGTLSLQIDARGLREGRCLRGHVLTEVGTYSAIKHGKRVAVCAECQRQHSKKSQYGHDIDPVIRPAFHSRLLNLDLIGNKHIPPIYLRASVSQRMELLRGLMDTDGHIDPLGRNCEIASSYPALAAGIIELIRSLGFKPSFTRRTPKGGKESTRIRFAAYSDFPVFHLSRKRNRLRREVDGRPSETFRRRIVAVEPVHSRPVRCIAVDSPTHLFLAGEAMVPTHNTEVGLNWLGYVMHHAPGPMLTVLPTLEVAERWVMQRLNPMLAETPALRAIYDAKRSRDAANSKQIKDFPGGMLVIGGANSPASLASMPIRYVLCDEVDRFPWEVGQEGDPLGLIDERTKTFPRRKVLLVSTPTVKGSSRIEMEYQRSDMREFHVPCPHCGEYQVLRWKHDNGIYGLRHNDATGAVYYSCQHCGERIDEHHKPQMLARGRWIARHPERSTRGYHLSGLYSPLGLGFTWAELWQKWQESHGDTANLKRFINTTLGESWEEQGDSIEDIALIARLEDYPDKLPAALTTAGVDVQKDRLEASVVKWGAGEEAWMIDHLILPGDTARPEVWDDLDEALKDAGVQFAAIDSGFNTSMVYAFTEKRRWTVAIKGVTGMGRPLIEDERKRRQRMRNARKKAVRVEPIGVDQGKALIYSRLKLTQTGAGYIHFPRDPAFDDEYFAQLAAEKLVTKIKGTRPFSEWVQTRPRNEALDCLVYATAAMRLAGRPLDKTDPSPAGKGQGEGKTDQPTAPTHAGETVVPTTLKRPTRRGNYASNWR